MSFKVPCPSCEAPVLIKNPNLVGTKVECPKCKYRFKVEAPAADATAAADKKDKKPEKPAKPEKKAAAGAGGKKKKLVPVLVGVVALVILGGVGYAVLGGSGKKKDDPFKNTKRGGGSGGDEEQNPEEKKDDKVVPPKPSVPASDRVTTNLLPGQSVAVYRFNMDPVRGSPAYGSLIDQQVVSMFQGTLGFAPDDVETYIHCFAGDGRDPFGVVKLKVATKVPDLLNKVPNRDAKTAVKGRDLYAFRSAPLLKAVSHAMAMRALFGDLYATLPMMSAAPPKDRPFGVCVYDTQHVLIGDYDLLKRFLGELDANGYPPFKSELSTAAAPTAPVPPAEAPKDSSDPKKAKEPEKTPVTPPPAGEKAYTSIDAYRTIELPLKRALDALEEDRTVTPLLVYAEKFDARQYDPKLMKKDYEFLSTTLDKIATPLRYLSANVTTFSQRQLVANVRLTFETASDARDLAKEQLSPGLPMPGLPMVIELMKLRLETQIEFRDYTVPGGSTPGTVPGGFPPGMMPPGGVPPGSLPPIIQPPGGSGVPPGSLPPVIQPPGGGGGAVKPGGVPPRPGPMGSGESGPGSGEPAVVQPTKPAVSHVDLALVDNQLLIAIDVTWTETVYRTTIDPRMSGVTNQVKGKMAVVASDSSWHTLAAAGKAAGATATGFPRGTTDKLTTDSNRFGLPHPPGQRVSLFADLLPYMGHDGLSRRINRTKPWYALERAKPDEKTPDKPGEVLVDNLSPAGEWVPQLLVPYYPQSAWRAASPYAPDHAFGATNYVALSGTGLDSARYDPKSPEYKAKVGMTGYGWGSKAEEVTDGLSNTIYLIQTPPGLQQPWIAGGGATVRGFDENDPMSGYKFTHPGGKEGTYALMGDGSVRFIPATIDKKVLLAMGTRAGGDNAALADVNKHSTKVDPPNAPPPEAKPEPKPAAMPELAPPPREKK